MLLSGCDRLTSIESPDLVQGDQLQSATGAAALYAGAHSLFATAYNGATNLFANGFVHLTGLMSDELRDASNTVLAVAFDIRDLSPSQITVGEAFAALSRARVTALGAAEALRVSAPTPASRISQSFAIAAFSEMFIGQLYCSGAPLSDVVNGMPADYGSPLTTQQLFERAAADFDSAIATSGNDATSLNLASVGKARALVEVGDFDAAAAAVSAVPTTFAFSITYSAASLQNRLAQLITVRAVTVADDEGVNGLDFRTANDPRVQVSLVGRGTDGVTDVYNIVNLTTSSPTFLASGIQARLIEAEAALRRGDTEWLTILNALRASAISPALSPLTDPGTDPQRVDLLFRERAFWLFATGNRQADLRRLIRQYGRTVGNTSPTGAYTAGRSYTDDVTASLPVQESIRNPKFTGCIDRNA